MTEVKLVEGAPLKVEQLSVSGMVVVGSEHGKPVRLGRMIDEGLYEFECACRTCEAARALGLGNESFACAAIA